MHQRPVGNAAVEKASRPETYDPVLLIDARTLLDWFGSSWIRHAAVDVDASQAENTPWMFAVCAVHLAHTIEVWPLYVVGSQDDVPPPQGPNVPVKTLYMYCVLVCVKLP